MNTRLRIAHACAVGALALLLAGCKGTTESGASVRLVNATSDYATLDLYAGTSAASTGIASYAVGNYVDLDPATYSFNLEAGGSGAISATTSAAVVKDVDYTLVAYTTGGTLNAQVLTDNEAAPTSGTAKLRIFHTASADAGSVDVYLVTSACANLASVSASATASGVTGLQTSYTQVTAATGGTAYHVCVTAAGDKTDLRLDIPALTLTNQQIATLVLTRSAGGVLLHGLLLNQQGTLTPELNLSARMRLAAGAAASAAVSATANGVALGTGLTAPAVSSYQLVPAGALTLAVTVGGNPAASTASLTATAGADLTLLVTGTAASAPVLLADDNTVSTSTTRPTKLRLVNGMTGTGSTAILTDDYSNVGAGAVYGAASTYALVAASAALARLEATYGSQQLCLSTGVTLASGSVYTVFLLGDTPATAGTCVLRADR